MNFNAAAQHYDLSNLQASLLTCEVVQNISNDKEIDENIIDKKLPVRVKQTSDVVLVEKFCAVQRVASKNLKTMASILDEAVYLAEKQKCHPILAPSIKSPVEVIKELCHHNGICTAHIKSFGDSVEAEHQALLGDIDSTI